jgi:DNA primase catalytic core
VETVNSFRYPVEEIREKCDLVEVISAHVALRKTGRNFTGLCPFHNEKTPSFSVNAERQIWKCFGCGEGGDVFKFVQKIDNLTFPQAVEALAQKVGVTIERSEQASREYSDRERILKANNIACAFFRSSLERSAKAKEYLANRGLTTEAIERYKLGYAPDGWDGLLNHLAEQRIAIGDAVKAGLLVARESSTGFYDRFRDRLIFPIVDASERIIAFGGRSFGDEQPKYLNSPETPLFAKNRTLYGLNIARKAIPDDGRAIVVEGYMDAITAQSAGFVNTVATLGTALTEEHVNVISRFTKNVVLAFDSDSAGMKAALRSAPIFEQAGFNVRILNMPKGEDPDSMLRGGDVSRFAGLLERTLPIPDYRIKLALSAHDLHADEGKAAGLKEAVDILAGVESAVERERLIRFLAKYHANFGTGTTLAEDHIRGEVERLRVRAARRGGDRSSPATAARSNRLATEVSLVERAERLLLGIILFRQTDASKVFDILSPKEFTGGDTSVLAEALSRQHSELGKIDQEDLRVRVADTPAESLLLDMLVGLDGSELDESVDGLIQVIITHKKNERRARMRDLAAKIEQGLIKHGDEDYEEYVKLIRDTSSAWRR